MAVVFVVTDRQGWAFDRIAAQAERHLSPHQVCSGTPADLEGKTPDLVIVLWYGSTRTAAALVPQRTKVVTCIYDDYYWTGNRHARASLVTALGLSDGVAVANRIADWDDASGELPDDVRSAIDAALRR